MGIAELTALLFLLTQFTTLLAGPRLPCSIFHAALLLLHASRDAGVTEMEQSSSTGRNLGARQKRNMLQFPLLHLYGLCYSAAELQILFAF